jgi:hypothetical protein
MNDEYVNPEFTISINNNMHPIKPTEIKGKQRSSYQHRVFGFF